MTSNTTIDSYIPPEAYLYFPKGDDLRAKDGQRMIFDGNTEFNDHELRMIAKFNSYLEKHKETLTTMWTDNMILRFLYANGFKMEKTLSSIKSYTQWRNTTLPIQVDKELQDLLNSGIIYVHGRDHRFRPIIVFNVYKLDPKKIDINLVTRALTHLFEYIIDEWMLPGQVENWVFIGNVKGMSLSSVASHSVRNLFIYLQDNYKCRLHSIYIINAASTIYVPWNIVKKLLDETTVQKVHFYRTQKISDLFKHTNPEQIEEQFGGSARNATQYWPPQLPSNNYFVSPDDTKDLVSKEDYISLSQSGQLKNMRLNKSLIAKDFDYLLEDEELIIPDKLLRRTSSQVVNTVPDPEYYVPKPLRLSTAVYNRSHADSDLFDHEDPNKRETTVYQSFIDDAEIETDYVEDMNERVKVNQGRSEIKRFTASFMSEMSPKHTPLP